MSGAGKSTIAAALAERLRTAEPGRAVTILDGDELRRRGSADLGFDAASRAIQVERAARIAADLAAHGEIVLSALIAPFTAARARARELIEPAAPFLLVWVRVPLAVAEARDVKGLYARARRGEIDDFTGISSPYEEPGDADLVIDTNAVTVDAAVDAILGSLEALLA